MMKLLSSFLLGFVLFFSTLAEGQNRPQFVQRTWTFVMPLNDDAVYLAGPLTRPSWWDPSIKFVEWPKWLPRKLYIASARASHQDGAAPFSQFVMSIDYDGTAMRTGLPPWYQQTPGKTPTDWAANTGLVSLWPGSKDPHDRTLNYDPPFYFDADKDYLWFQQPPGDVWFWQLGFYVPAPAVDVQPLVSRVWSGWENVVGPVFMDGETDYSGYTISSYVSPHWIKNTSAGTEVEVTFEAGATPLTISRAYIGPGDGGHAMTSATQLFNGASASITIPANSKGTMKAASGIDGTIGYVIRAEVSSGTIKFRSHNPVDLHRMGQGWGTAHAAGAHGPDLVPSAFTIGTGAVGGFSEVKQKY